MLTSVSFIIDKLNSLGFFGCIYACLSNVHVVAFMFGGTIYLGYIALSSGIWTSWPSVDQTFSSDASSDESEKVPEVSEARWSKRRTFFTNLAAVLTVVVAILFGLTDVARRRRQASVCSDWRKEAGLTLATGNLLSVGLRETLAEAKGLLVQEAAQLDSGSTGILRDSFGNYDVSRELRNSTSHYSASDAFQTRVSDDDDDPFQILVPPALTYEIQTARNSASGYAAYVDILIGQLRAIRKAKPLPAAGVLKLFVKLHSMENHFRLALADVVSGAKSLKNGVTNGKLSPASRSVALQEQLEELRVMRSDIRAQSLRIMLEARQVAALLPQSDAGVRLAMSCEPSLLTNFHDLAIREAEQDSDASVAFTLGLYWSELGVAVAGVPFLSGSNLGEHSVGTASGAGWTVDNSFEESSRRVPAMLIRAETLLFQGEEQTVDQSTRIDRRAERALRLYQHAKSLALMHHDTAAEARYIEAAKVASSSNRPRLACHALTRLSYFLLLGGKTHRALKIADEALAHGHDPLALFVQITLRRSLGKLSTSGEITAAEAQLKSVAGLLPSPKLEAERGLAQHELSLWRQAATQDGLRPCFAMEDIARVVLCIFSKAMFLSDATQITAP